MRSVDKCINQIPACIIGDDSISLSIFFLFTRVQYGILFLLPFSLYLGMQVDPCTLYLKYYLLWRLLLYVNSSPFIAFDIVTSVVYGSQQSIFS